MRGLWAALAFLGGVFVFALVVGRLAGDVPVGGETISGVEGERFVAAGSLIHDKDLLKEAAVYWKDHDHDEDGGLDDHIRALWAGEIGSGRTVILQRAAEFAAVTFGAGEPRLSPATLRGNRFIAFDAGILLPTGAPDRWTEVVDTGTTVTTEAQRAFDHLLIFATRDALAVIPDEPGVVMAGLERDFGVGTVEAEDWEAFRRAITAPRTARTTAAAAAEALNGGPGAGDSDTYAETGVEFGDPEGTVFSRALRILHNDEDGVATAAWDGKGTAIGFATGDPPTAQLLGRHEAGGPGLAAAHLDGGPIVVAGDKEVKRIEVAGRPSVKGNFAIVLGTGEDMPVVRGRLADGSEVYAAGGGYSVPDLDEG